MCNAVHKNVLKLHDLFVVASQHTNEQREHGVQVRLWGNITNEVDDFSVSAASCR